ncbi:amino acid kinase family protein [Roseiconus lacunae]|uniref:Amino acid kinase family protein n=1 Tax=Roseiconus lacunae TaxID=2605694 RepID=A0ABT7PJ35_9BACT|nr:hypothetical protein [Roseiconus lacunae]MCD0461374.1 hypothetical protein [Roseiconus lacunae]MDM4016201.1 hypothetical protein [Roseiconus lacunae]
MRRVIKLGGSLLLRPNLSSAFQRWLAQQSPADNYVIVGGGRLIDAVRELHAIHASSAAWTHWNCVQLLQTTFHWLSSQFPHASTITTSDQFQSSIQQTSSDRLCFVQVDAFYFPTDEVVLPEDWRTTTDAIAGYLGKIIDADEVVLLKSCDASSLESLQRWADRGIIDEAMPLIAEGMPPVRIVNFKEWLAQ